MRAILAMTVVALLAGCAVATVRDIEAARPVLAMRLRDEPPRAAECVVRAIGWLGWFPTVREFGDTVQIVWGVAPLAPIATFDLVPAARGSSIVEMHARPGVGDPGQVASLWSARLRPCAAGEPALAGKNAT